MFNFFFQKIFVFILLIYFLNFSRRKKPKTIRRKTLLKTSKITTSRQKTQTTLIAIMLKM